MLREERLWRITQRLRQNRQVTSRELADMFGLTAASARADLAELARRGLARRVYGGAVLINPSPTREPVSFDEPAIGERLDLQRAEKEAIGRAAVGLIRDGETIMIDAGSTTLQVCRYLSKVCDLTVVSCALNEVWPELVSRPDTEVFLTGGYLRPRSLAMVGEVAESMLRGFRANKAILGIDGVSLEHGLTTQNFLEASIKRRMIEASQELIVVADHSKLGRVGLIPVAPLERITTLVTDDGAAPEILHQLAERGVDVLMADAARHA